jgi:hypothetical protein
MAIPFYVDQYRHDFAVQLHRRIDHVSSPFRDPIIKRKQVSTNLCHFRITQVAGALTEPIPISRELYPRITKLFTKSNDHCISAAFGSA